jgi:UDPglucose 6-dehydrogenase
MKITVVGTGFVGVVTAAVYASFGHEVVGVDIAAEKVASLRNSIVPFYEPGLTELLRAQQEKGNLTFTTAYETAIPDSDVVVIAVGTPSKSNGDVDLQYVFASCESMAPHLKENAVVVVKSTVPPGTLTAVQATIAKFTDTSFHTASVPEFLKEGTAVADTLHPDRIVLGATNEFVFSVLEELHAPLRAPIIKVSPESAQMAKYSANAYLATRITFINQIADLCETTGADVQEVISAIGPDKRIGEHYWYPGLGYGGSCFPKDVKELAAYSRKVGFSDNLFNKINELNDERPATVLKKYEQAVGGWDGKRVAVLGLAFKPHTNDMREAPSLRVIPTLLGAGATVIGFDPEAVAEAGRLLEKSGKLSLTDQIEEAVATADIIIALIEWPEILTFAFGELEKSASERWFIDARNQFDPEKVRSWGYAYLGVGRA